MSTTFRSAALLPMILLAGCGRSAGPVAHVEKVVPVAGTLTYLGNPLKDHQVAFLPTDGRRPAIGVTDAAGKFTLGTNRPGDGAPPGSHKVAIVWVCPSSSSDAGQEPVIDNPAFLPRPTIRIPAKYGNAESSGITQEVPPGGLNDLKIDLK